MFYGEGYKILNEVPIVKMPEVLLMALQNAQANRVEEVIDHKLYDLLRILDYEWFNEYDHIMQIIHALRIL
jgi:hypothetical protein